MKLEYLELGKIVGTHGVKGELRAEAWCDSPDFFASFKRIYVDSKEMKVIGARPHGNIMLLKLQGVEDIDTANTYRGKKILVKREDANVEEGHYFIAELLGSKVVDANDESHEYGKIVDVTNTGASDIWHIKKDGQEFLFPAAEDFVESVDIENSVAKIKPIRGMFSEEAEEIRED